MKCEECNIIGFSIEELLPDGFCMKCRINIEKGQLEYDISAKKGESK